MPRLDQHARDRLQRLKEEALEKAAEAVDYKTRRGVFTGAPQGSLKVVVGDPGRPSSSYVKKWMKTGLEPEVVKLLEEAGVQADGPMKMGVMRSSGGRPGSLSFFIKWKAGPSKEVSSAMKPEARKKVATALRAAARTIVGAPFSDRPLPEGEELFDKIRPRSRVTIVTPQGQKRTGRAVMYNRQYDSWVLNMGGRHGTPGIATRENVVKVSGSVVSAYKRGTFVPTRDLPRVVQKALKAVGYHKRDVELVPSETFTRGSGGSAFEGNRAYNVFVNLKTNKYDYEYGSWGGSNMFEQKGADLDTKKRPLPDGILHIQGEGGGRGNFARIYVNPKTLAPLMPTTEDVTDEEQSAIRIIDGIKSGYRKEEFRRAGLGPYAASNPIIQSLVKKGMIKVNKRGAVMMTTKGRNARTGW